MKRILRGLTAFVLVGGLVGMATGCASETDLEESAETTEAALTPADKSRSETLVKDAAYLAKRNLAGHICESNPEALQNTIVAKLREARRIRPSDGFMKNFIANNDDLKTALRKDISFQEIVGNLFLVYDEGVSLWDGLPQALRRGATFYQTANGPYGNLAKLDFQGQKVGFRELKVSADGKSAHWQLTRTLDWVIDDSDALVLTHGDQVYRRFTLNRLTGSSAGFELQEWKYVNHGEDSGGAGTWVKLGFAGRFQSFESHCSG